MTINNILKHLMLTAEEYATHLVFEVAHVQITISIWRTIVCDPQLSILSASFA